jgi:hypothetical protein
MGIHVSYGTLCYRATIMLAEHSHTPEGILLRKFVYVLAPPILLDKVMSVREEEELPMHSHDPRDYLPDIRDGLTQRERIVLQCLYDLQQERGGRNVPTGMLYGTVVEYVDMSVEEMQSILVRLIGHPLRS